jgi:hypothetical protein
MRTLVLLRAPLLCRVHHQLFLNLMLSFRHSHCGSHNCLLLLLHIRVEEIGSARVYLSSRAEFGNAAGGGFALSQ